MAPGICFVCGNIYPLLANRADRPMPAALHSAVRFAVVVDVIGAALVAVGVCGFFYFG